MGGRDVLDFRRGVSPFDGVFGTSWYGWASRGTTHREGKLRRLKFLAKLDAWKLERQLRRSAPRSVQR
jgi:hypothetical protein